MILVCRECGHRPIACPCSGSIRTYPLITLDAYRRKIDDYHRKYPPLPRPKDAR